MKRDTLSIGTVSHGTMRPEHLRESFYWECKNLRMSRADRAKVYAMMRANGTELCDSIDEMFDVLNNYCPAYCYFGATEGDGSDYGCWPMIESVLEDIHNGEIVDVEEMPPAYTGYAVQITDHGNVTLYSVTRGRTREAWSVV